MYLFHKRYLAFVKHINLDLRSFAYSLVMRRRHLANFYGFTIGDWYIGALHIPKQPE